MPNIKPKDWGYDDFPEFELPADFGSGWEGGDWGGDTGGATGGGSLFGPDFWEGGDWGGDNGGATGGGSLAGPDGGFDLGRLFGGAGNSLGSLLRGITGGGGAGGGSLLSSLLPLLGLIGGGINTNNATNRASEQLQGAARQAQDDARGLIGGARDDFKPYQAAGVDALARMQAQPPSNLAGNYSPIGQESNLADKFKSMTLASLARR